MFCVFCVFCVVLCGLCVLCAPSILCILRVLYVLCVVSVRCVFCALCVFCVLCVFCACSVRSVCSVWSDASHTLDNSRQTAIGLLNSPARLILLSPKLPPRPAVRRALSEARRRVQDNTCQGCECERSYPPCSTAEWEPGVRLTGNEKQGVKSERIVRKG